MTQKFERDTNNLTPLDQLVIDKKIALVIAPSVGRGASDNRAAVLATGLAAHHPEIVGDGMTTADGQQLLGFTKLPIVVLAAKEGTELRDMAAKAREVGCTVLVFLTRAQGMRSYDAYRDSVAASNADELDVDAFIVFGPKKSVNSLVGSFPSLR